jgi:phage recombination protein Bet
MTIATHNGGQSLATRPAALAIRPGQEMWSDKQRAALAALGIKDATNGDLAVYMHYCQKTGLDPFSRQIYMIARREKQGDQWVSKQTIQVGIDGFRVIRDRIAARLGVDVEYEDTIWYDASGQPHDVWIYEEPPVACRVVVVRNGRRFPAVVRTAAYMQRNKQGDPAGQWKTQADHMIEKCAEAFALRRAFPNDLGGLYIDDEMAAAPPPPVPAQAVRVGTGGITASNGHTGTPGPAAGAARTEAASPAGPGAPDAPEPPGASQQAGQDPPPASADAPAAPRVKPVLKRTLGRLKGALFAVPLGNSQDTQDAVCALAGRTVLRPEDLHEDEALAVLAAIDAALEGAGGDKDAAAAALLERVAAVLTAQAQDEAAEGQASDG